jgi:phage portal protein BeeE
MFSNMEIQFVNVNGDKIELPQYQNLIANPNPMQSMNKWLHQFKCQEQIYGNQFMYFNKPSAISAPAAIWNVSPRYMQPILTGKVFDQIEAKDVISGFNYTEIGAVRTFETKDIMYTKMDDLDNPVIGTSPLVSLQFPLSNTKLAYQYRNIIMAEKGAIGILSNKSKDAAGPVPMTPAEKKRIQDEYINRYGIGANQQRVILTEADLDWQPMTYPTKDLLLFEEVDANAMTIIDAFGLNVNIFSSKSATFENVRQGILLCYQDTIVPEAESFTQSISTYLGLPSGVRAAASYEHVAIFKDVNQKNRYAIGNVITAIQNAVQAGFITQDQAINLMATELQIPVDVENSKPVLTALNKLSPLVANNALQSMTVNEVRSIVGLPTVSDGDNLLSASAIQNDPAALL